MQSIPLNVKIAFHLHLVVPTPPVIKQLTVIGSRSVYVEWNRPVNFYGILSHYTIIYVTENVTTNLTTPYNGIEVSTHHIRMSSKLFNVLLKNQVQFYNITGLRPYQPIRVTITATNGAGTSEPSNKVSGRTHEAGIAIF